jgi:hypothetical protein
MSLGKQAEALPSEAKSPDFETPNNAVDWNQHDSGRALSDHTNDSWENLYLK